MKALCFVLLSFLLRLGASAGTDVVMTMPFENESKRAEYNWIGESFAITLATLLDTPGMIAISPDERNLAYERLGLRASDLLTRAAMIRIAEAAQANLAVMGTFDIGDKTTIAIKARLVETREGRLVANKVFNLSGPLAKLQEMQGQLAWSILYERNPGLTYSKDQLVRRATSIPPRAYESFAKGIQTPDHKLRENFLRRSIQEYDAARGAGHFADAIYQLGLFYYGQKNYAEAAKTFAQLTENDPHYLESLFYGGVAFAQTNDYKSAIAAYEKLLKPMPLFEVWNNAGSMMAALGNQDEALRLLRQAVANSPSDPIYRFNYGYALWRYGKFDEAAEHLRVALSAGSSNDGEAQYLLAKSLKATGPHDEAQQADDEARRLLDNRYAKWEIAPEQMPILARMKTDFSRAAYYKLERQQQRTAALPSTQLILQQQVFDRARRLASEGKDVEALAELQRLLDANGSMSEAHLLKAQLHQRRNETDQAISSYLLAIDRNPRLVAAHVALGQIYFARGDRARAIAHSKQAIEIDPRDREAVALWSQIGTGR
jgi:tetratricopeptide (TPR) repeat protein